MFQWLKQCCRAKNINDTNISLMDFSQLFYNIQANRFFCQLPPNIKKLHSGKSTENKKRKQGDRIINDSPVQSWKLRQDENWDVIFKGKTNNGPSLSMNCKGCLKFHVKGICYEDCLHKASHCLLTGNNKLKTDSYIKSLLEIN